MRTLVLSAAVVAALSVPAQAGETGLAGMHAQAPYNGRTCFSGHTHTGTGEMSPTKQAAVASATRDWQSFTALEYGTDWASWARSMAKTTSCTPYGNSWRCVVQARPCRATNTRRYHQARR